MNETYQLGETIMNEQTMSEQDWDVYLGEWGASFGYREPPTIKNILADPPAWEPEQPTKDNEGNKLYNYIRKGRSTPKAQFYFTEDGIAGNFGFWVPKRAIALDNTGERIVAVESWCKITIIEFN